MTDWQKVNLDLIAKAISELHFEEVLTIIPDGSGYRLDLKSGASYRFNGTMSAWGHLWVDATSLNPDLRAGQFFIDTRHETGMSEITLGTFLEEMNQTLYSDLQREGAPEFSAHDLAEQDGETLQHSLDGHPKLLLNKGRMGWSAADLAAYAPESSPKFQLRWILALRSSLTGSEVEGWNLSATLEQSFQGAELQGMEKKLEAIETDSYVLMPVHPWQWDQVIVTQFQSELQEHRIIDLGVGGDFYSPQVSLRTLSNVDRPLQHDLKLPLSILNTSCVRGLPQKYLPLTPKLSIGLKKLSAADSLLGFGVQSEIAAYGYVHPLAHQVEGASYRYHEQLGAVWRESVQSKLEEDEKAVLVSSLLHWDRNERSLLAAYVERSGLELNEWISLYARAVIVPLYHLQLAYGVGVVAHGQNIVLKLKAHKPVGFFLKDFHGDLRLSTVHQKIHETYFQDIADFFTHLPPEHLIHDLITGHFVTVLRFMARVMNEAEFYKIISEEISTYAQKNKPLITPSTDLLVSEFQRVLVNRVRFKIGYGDSAERPLPILGNKVKNPLHREKA